MKLALSFVALPLLLVGFNAAGCHSAPEDPFPPGTQLAVGAPPGASTRLGSASAPAPAGLTDVRFSVGRAEFLEGNFVMIREVYASSPRLVTGDQVVVRGEYQLSSADEAMLALNVTGGRSRGIPGQRTKVGRGTGAFELVCEIPYPGELHASFYPTRGGSSFGGIYIFPR